MSSIGGVDAVGELAASIAAAVGAVPGVARLSGGAYGTVATYLAGRRVEGVVLDDDAVRIAIVGRLGHDLAAVADQVRSAARALCDLPVDVVIADLDVPTEPTPTEPTPTEPTPAEPTPADTTRTDQE